MLPTLAVVGTLYEDSPTRLCSAYLLGNQQRLGAALVWAAAAALFAWLFQLRQAVLRDCQWPARQDSNLRPPA